MASTTMLQTTPGSLGERFQMAEEYLETNGCFYPGHAGPMLEILTAYKENLCLQVHDNHSLSQLPSMSIGSYPVALVDIISLCPRTVAQALKPLFMDDPDDGEDACWLDDSVMNAIVSLHCATGRVSAQRHFDHQITLTYLYPRVMMSTGPVAVSLKRNTYDPENPLWPFKSLPQNASRVMFFYNFKGTHWMLAKINIPMHTITCWDSMRKGQGRRDGPHPILRKIAYLAGLRPGSPFSRFDWLRGMTVQTRRAATQTNESDCGLFATNTAISLLSGLPPENRVTGHELRQRFLEKIANQLQPANVQHEFPASTLGQDNNHVDPDLWSFLMNKAVRASKQKRKKAQMERESTDSNRSQPSVSKRPRSQHKSKFHANTDKSQRCITELFQKQESTFGNVEIKTESCGTTKDSIESEKENVDPALEISHSSPDKHETSSDEQEDICQPLLQASCGPKQKLSVYAAPDGQICLNKSQVSQDDLVIAKESLASDATESPLSAESTHYDWSAAACQQLLDRRNDPEMPPATSRDYFGVSSQRMFDTCRQDDFDIKYDIVVSIMRHSAAPANGKRMINYRPSKDLELARDHAILHSKFFSPTDTPPAPFEPYNDYREIDDDALKTRLKKTKMPIYLPELRLQSSRRYDLLTERGDTSWLQNVLMAYSELCVSKRTRGCVILLFPGLDGGTTCFASWCELCQAYPGITFRLTMLLNDNTDTGGLPFNFTQGFAWLHLELDVLVDVIQRAGNTALADQPSPFPAHQTYYQALRWINEYKEGRSNIRHRVDSRSFRGSFLCGPMTRTLKFYFNGVEKRHCDICEVDHSDKWYRGHGILSFLCEVHQGFTGYQLAPESSDSVRSKIKLKPHRRTRDPEHRVVVFCCHCGSQHYTMEYLRKHEELPHTWPCAFRCGMSFILKQSAEKHTYSCELAPK